MSERSQDFTPGKKNILVFLTANTPGAVRAQICIRVFRGERSEARAEPAKHNQPSEAHCFNEKKNKQKNKKLLCDEVALSEMWTELHFMKYFWFMSLFLEPVCWCFCGSSTVHTAPRGRIKPFWDLKKQLFLALCVMFYLIERSQNWTVSRSVMSIWKYRVRRV